MTKCPSCASETPENSRFCSTCGENLAEDVFATRTVAAANPAANPGVPRSSPRTPVSGSSRLGSSSSPSHSESRFVPGTLLAGRYRIVSLLGKGGMGEVYRADDLTLDQPVALKFLPDGALSSENALTRFRNEVRVARQVSHPNVCRVYDVGEIDGHIFLSMEYVDGEDLGSLLRRIGRVPSDKALEICRKLCAGLAAAHEKGVLHRDLKPSNVMLDSRGQVLLTDFGLAGLADQITGNEVRNGTPQYMAPEQLAGKEVTTRSDIYSLGLVFYEIFTGKRPFEATSMAELMQAQTKRRPSACRPWCAIWIPRWSAWFCAAWILIRCAVPRRLWRLPLRCREVIRYKRHWPPVRRHRQKWWLLRARVWDLRRASPCLCWLLWCWVWLLITRWESATARSNMWSLGIRPRCCRRKPAI